MKYRNHSKHKLMVAKLAMSYSEIPHTSCTLLIAYFILNDTCNKIKMSIEQNTLCLNDIYPKRKDGISKSVDYIHIQLALLERKTLNVLFCLLPTLAVFNVANPGGLTSTQTIFILCSHVLKHVVGNCNHNIPYVGCPLLKITFFDWVHKVLYITTQVKNPVGLILVT